MSSLNLPLGAEITFGTSGNFANYSPAGWSLTSEHVDRTWTTASFSQLLVPILNTRAAQTLRLSSTLRFEADPFVGGHGPNQQQLSIFLNGLLVGHLVADSPAAVDATFTIPPRAWGEDMHLISLMVPMASIPRNNSGDQRRLGWSVKRISVALSNRGE